MSQRLGLLPGPRPTLLVTAVVAFGLVVVALVLTEWLRLAACPLCIFQRVLYLGIAATALLAAACSGKLRSFFVLLALGLACWGVGVAAWQSWLQAFPDPALECNFSDPTLIEQLVNWLGMQWPRVFMATGFCSSKEWVLLGLSMANWSALTFALLSAVLGVTLRRR